MMAPRSLLARALIALLLTGAPLTSLSAQQPTPTADGFWERLDSSGGPEGLFHIFDCDGVYQGKIVKIFPRPGEDPSSFRCAQCEGE
jgi:hypothetical protein